MNRHEAPTFMFIAGEASGDLLAAELVGALRHERPQANFFGAGGPRMAEAGVELAEDMARHSIIGIWEVVKKYFEFRRLMARLVKRAFERRPDVIVCVDFSGFNSRFARAVRARIAATGADWRPRIVQYVSPQVWASRPGRAKLMARDYDLLLCILPFEQAWYARHAPELCVEFVGHPIVDRHGGRADNAGETASTNTVLLLPGSREGELRRHMPPMLDALQCIREVMPETRFQLVLPDATLAAQARPMLAAFPDVQLQIGKLAEALRTATVAIASTGTVTLECAWFGVPTVALYRTSWPTYLIGRCIVSVDYLAMPNLLANEPIFPELIQHEATGPNIARETLALLKDAPRRAAITTRLVQIVATLGEPGASQRAATAVLRLC
ncbi:MAG: lipid-A-disaccharide synthase [Pedosphaera sp.]|nr:lipid-A-disaccharide synthase [Pedosphaera sp.]